MTAAHARPIESEFWRFAFPSGEGKTIDLSSLRYLPWFEVCVADVLAILPLTNGNDPFGGRAWALAPAALDYIEAFCSISPTAAAIKLQGWLLDERVRSRGPLSAPALLAPKMTALDAPPVVSEKPAEPPPPTKAHRRGGRKPALFWEKAKEAALKWLDDYGCPAEGDCQQAKLEHFIMNWIGERPGGSQPNVRKHVGRWVRERRAAQSDQIIGSDPS
jgi:hypothetical protein